MAPETVIVCYAHDDPLRFQADTISRVVRAGRCGNCGTNVFVNASGARAIRERDCALLCRQCRALSQHHPTIIDGL